MRINHAFFYIFLSIIVSSEGRSSDWEKISEKEGILVYKKQNIDSPLITIKGEGIIEEPIEKIVSVLLDIPRTVEWVDFLQEAKVLKKIDEFNFISYAHFKSPFFMVQDRDFLTQCHVEFHPKINTVIIHVKSIEEIYPLKKSIVRGFIAESTMTLKSLSENQTFLSSTVHSDPKGSIPTWIVNTVAKRTPNMLFKSLKKQLAKKD